MKASLTAWAAIRRNTDDHHEFIDLSSVSSVYEQSILTTKETERDFLNWTHANPVRRIVKVEIIEI